MDLLVDLNERDGATVVAVLHDLAPRGACSSRGVLLVDRRPDRRRRRRRPRCSSDERIREVFGVDPALVRLPGGARADRVVRGPRRPSPTAPSTRRSPLDELRAAIATLTRIPMGRGSAADRVRRGGVRARGCAGSGSAARSRCCVLGARDAARSSPRSCTLAAIAIVSGRPPPRRARRHRRRPRGDRSGGGRAGARRTRPGRRRRGRAHLRAGPRCRGVDSLVRTVGPPAAAAVLVVAAAGSRAFAVGVAFVARGRAVGDGPGRALRRGPSRRSPCSSRVARRWR